MKKLKLLAALTACFGVVLLGSSFIVDPGTPANPSTSELITYGQNHLHAAMWMSWLQLVGTFLLLVFALTVVRLTNTIGKLSGILTMLGAMVLMIVSGAETIFYIGSLYSNPQVSLDLIHATQHLYFIIAVPALFIPLGFSVLASSHFPRWLGYLGIIFGIIFAILGVTTLYKLVLPTPVTAFASIQTIWWLLAAVFCLRLDEV